MPGGGGSDQCGAWASCRGGGVTSVGPGLHAGGGAVTSVGPGLHACELSHVFGLPLSPLHPSSLSFIQRWVFSGVCCDPIEEFPIRTDPAALNARGVVHWPLKSSQSYRPCLTACCCSPGPLQTRPTGLTATPSRVMSSVCLHLSPLHSLITSSPPARHSTS